MIDEIMRRLGMYPTAGFRQFIGATEIDVANFQRSLRVALPLVYIDFLKKYPPCAGPLLAFPVAVPPVGWASLGLFYGISPLISKGDQISEVTAASRDNIDFPENAIVIASDPGSGNIIMLLDDFSIHYHFPEGEIFFVAKDFETFASILYNLHDEYV